ncbi:hypothetical protein AX14_000033 [Amanita brunnescens Koide BX004]|nr:hypothetical protein AX14_000033 [Amanita brunnescens Koide BX004]
MARRASLSRNMKQLSIAIPAPQLIPAVVPPVPAVSGPRRRPSAVSLPAISAALRRDEEPSPSAPYADGPALIVPGIWLGSEDNARDWPGLGRRGIRAILNVAKEVSLPFDLLQPAHPPFLYPPHAPSERPPMHYLNLQWSHGQQNLVDDGFKQAMAFTDAALQRGDGVLIHCQCGVSRSATLVIALVMRAAAERASSVPPEVWSLKGMHDAYSYVKEKSKWISPNMSLIYQLLEYQKRLKSDTGSVDSSELSPPSLADEEEAWGRQRRLMDEQERESTFVLHEARALDKAMEDRFIARRSSSSSLCSSSSGMGYAWRTRYGSRKRTGSVASHRTSGSILSENLVEQDEEAELLGVGGGFDSEKNAEESSSSTTSPDEDQDNDPSSNFVPPSASVHKTAFRISTFNMPRPRAKRRPPPIGLPTVPSSPITLIVDSPITTSIKVPSKPSSPYLSVSTPVQRVVDSPCTLPERKHTPSLHTRNRALRKTRSTQDPLATPLASSVPQVDVSSQTLFVFPPSPTAISTPSTLTITSTPNASSILFPSTSRAQSRGRPRSFISLGTPATPTTAFTKLNVRGYVGFQG